MSNVMLIKKFKEEKCENNFDINNSFDSEKSIESIETNIEDLIEENLISVNSKNNQLIKKISLIIDKKKKIKSSLINLISVFHNDEIPKISIYDYITRIINYTNCEENTLILSLIYLDKLIMKNLKLSIYNIHRFLFASILIAIKVNEDRIYKNDYYSVIAGISLKELNLIECNFLSILDFQLFVNEKVFNNYKESLI